MSLADTHYRVRKNCSDCVYGSHDPSCKTCRGNHYVEELVPRLTFDGYAQDAGRTITPDQDNEERKMNAALGLAGEAGEVVELIKKARFHGVPYDIDRVRKELGDVLWYVNQMAYAHGLSLAEIAQANVEKLRARYPNGFVKAKAAK